MYVKIVNNILKTYFKLWPHIQGKNAVKQNHTSKYNRELTKHKDLKELSKTKLNM